MYFGDAECKVFSAAGTIYKWENEIVWNAAQVTSTTQGERIFRGVVEMVCCSLQAGECVHAHTP